MIFKKAESKKKKRNSAEKRKIDIPVRQKWQTKLVPALTLCQAPGMAANGVPILKSLVWLNPKECRRKQKSNPRSAALEADALTTRQ